LPGRDKSQRAVPSHLTPEPPKEVTVGGNKNNVGLRQQRLKYKEARKTGGGSLKKKRNLTQKEKKKSRRKLFPP